MPTLTAAQRYRLPPDQPPDQLYRQLLRVPRPTRQFEAWLPDQGRVQLEARALLNYELSELERDPFSCMAHSLYAGGLLLFDQPEELLDLPDPVVDQLTERFWPAFFACSPTYGRCDWWAWRERLLMGARYGANVSTVSMLGACYDVTVIGQKVRVVDRPDRFFGLPLNQLTDGHLMAFRVARHIHEEQNQ